MAERPKTTDPTRSRMSELRIPPPTRQADPGTSAKLKSRLRVLLTALRRDPQRWAGVWAALRLQHADKPLDLGPALAALETLRDEDVQAGGQEVDLLLRMHRHDARHDNLMQEMAQLLEAMGITSIKLLSKIEHHLATSEADETDREALLGDLIITAQEDPELFGDWARRLLAGDVEPGLPRPGPAPEPRPDPAPEPAPAPAPELATTPERRAQLSALLAALDADPLDWAGLWAALRIDSDDKPDVLADRLKRLEHLSGQDSATGRDEIKQLLLAVDADRRHGHLMQEMHWLMEAIGIADSELAGAIEQHIKTSEQAQSAREALLGDLLILAREDWPTFLDWATRLLAGDREPGLPETRSALATTAKRRAQLRELLAALSADPLEWAGLWVALRFESAGKPAALAKRLSELESLRDEEPGAAEDAIDLLLQTDGFDKRHESLIEEMQALLKAMEQVFAIAEQDPLPSAELLDAIEQHIDSRERAPSAQAARLGDLIVLAREDPARFRDWSTRLLAGDVEPGPPMPEPAPDPDPEPEPEPEPDPDPEPGPDPAPEPGPDPAPEPPEPGTDPMIAGIREMLGYFGYRHEHQVQAFLNALWWRSMEAGIGVKLLWKQLQVQADADPDGFRRTLATYLIQGISQLPADLVEPAARAGYGGPWSLLLLDYWLRLETADQPDRQSTLIEELKVKFSQGPEAIVEVFAAVSERLGDLGKRILKLEERLGAFKADGTALLLSLRAWCRREAQGRVDQELDLLRSWIDEGLNEPQTLIRFIAEVDQQLDAGGDTRLAAALYRLGLGAWLPRVEQWLSATAKTRPARAELIDQLLAKLDGQDRSGAEAVLIEQIIGIDDQAPPQDPIEACWDRIDAALGSLQDYPELQSGLEWLRRRGVLARNRSPHKDGLFQPGGLIGADELNTLLGAMLQLVVHHSHGGNRIGGPFDADPLGPKGIASLAIENRHLSPAVVDNSRLAADAVDTDQLRAGAVRAAHIADGTIDARHLGDRAVDYAALADEVRDALDDNGGPSTEGYLLYIDPADLIDTDGDEAPEEVPEHPGVPDGLKGFLNDRLSPKMQTPVVKLAPSGEVEIRDDFSGEARSGGKLIPPPPEPDDSGLARALKHVAAGGTTIARGTAKGAEAEIEIKVTRAYQSEGKRAARQQLAEVAGSVQLAQSVADDSRLGLAVDRAHKEVAEGLIRELARKPKGWSLSQDLAERKRHALTIDPSGLALAGTWDCGPITVHPGIGDNGVFNHRRKVRFETGKVPKGQMMQVAQRLLFAQGVQLTDDPTSSRIPEQAFSHPATIELLNHPERAPFGHTTVRDLNIRAVYRLQARDGLPWRVRIELERPYRDCAYAVNITPDLPPIDDKPDAARSYAPAVVTRARQYLEVAFHPYDLESTKVGFSLAIHGTLDD